MTNSTTVQTMNSPLPMQTLSPCPVEAKLEELGISLDESTQPNIKKFSSMCWRAGTILHVGGHKPERADGSVVMGTVGTDISIDEGYDAAKHCAIQILKTLAIELRGDWSKLVRIVKLMGFVNSADENHHPEVINGATDLLNEIFGARGVQDQSGVACEVECTIEIKEEYHHVSMTPYFQMSSSQAA
jgi:hypothetical protein